MRGGFRPGTVLGDPGKTKKEEEGKKTLELFHGSTDSELPTNKKIKQQGVGWG